MERVTPKKGERTLETRRALSSALQHPILHFSFSPFSPFLGRPRKAQQGLELLHNLSRPVSEREIAGRKPVASEVPSSRLSAEAGIDRPEEEREKGGRPSVHGRRIESRLFLLACWLKVPTHWPFPLSQPRIRSSHLFPIPCSTSGKWYD